MDDQVERLQSELGLDERGLARVKLSTKGGLMVCSDAGKDAVKDIPDADLKRFPVESVSCDSGAGTLIRSVAEYQDAPCRPCVTTTVPTASRTGSRLPSASAFLC